MRVFLSLFALILFGTCPGFAQTECLLYFAGGGSRPSYYLTSDSVVWSMTIGSGQSCVAGLRTPRVLLDNVEVITPPQLGEVTLAGPSFVYLAKAKGQDSFSVLVSGKINKTSGSSTIRVLVTVK
jgi:hypothetical protein